MEIEIVEFYKRNRNKGTVHVYIPEWDLDLRGIPVTICKEYVYATSPRRSAYDEGEKVIYPMITFTNREKHKAFYELIGRETHKYLKEQKVKK